jgi:hypothetical protein
MKFDFQFTYCQTVKEQDCSSSSFYLAVPGEIKCQSTREGEKQKGGNNSLKEKAIPETHEYTSLSLEILARSEVVLPRVHLNMRARE